VTRALIRPAQAFLPGLDAGAASPWCLRWRGGVHSWRHTADGGIDPHRYVVEPIADAAAAHFIRAQHYSGTSVAARFPYGLLDRRDRTLHGVAILSVPVSRAVLTNAFPTLEPYQQSLELGRFALLDECPANTETWFLARVLRLAHEAGIRGVVSFADPLPRRTLDGQLVLAGHVGTIYQASAHAIYTGRGTPRTLLLLPDATVLNGRALQKIRRQEVGHRYAEARLIAAGAPHRDGQSVESWLVEALDAAHIRRVRHPGPHRYLFPLGDRRERRQLLLGYQPHDIRPKRPDGSCQVK